MSETEHKFWRVAAILATLLTGLPLVYLMYLQYALGPLPEKRIELDRTAAINPLSDLSSFGNRATMTLKIEGETINNLRIASAWLLNAGKAPILPSDYHENIAITVKPPWRIVAVESDRLSGAAVRLHWNKVDAQRFEAQPALLNPGDRVWTHIYLTNEKANALGTFEAADEAVTPEWSARITNMRSIVEPPSIFDAEMKRWVGVWVDLRGWGLVFTIGAALLFQAVYLYLLNRVGIVRLRSGGILMVVGCSLLGWAAAESLATYLMPTGIAAMFGVQHWLNAPWILFHVTLISVLFWKARKHSHKRKAQEV